MHLGLLTPEEIRSGLDRLGLTQKESAQRLGIAEATLSHWLTDTQIQSRAMDNLMRLFLESEEARELLARKFGHSVGKGWCVAAWLLIEHDGQKDTRARDGTKMKESCASRPGVRCGKRVAVRKLDDCVGHEHHA